MCGLAGFAGITGIETRRILTFALGMGVDTRGGHAAGFASLNGSTPTIGRKLGYWINAEDTFLHAAAQASVAMLHGRFATCGERTIGEAHPFEVQRNGVPYLWGAHNGVIYNARSSAKRHGRPFDVDSRELFEVLSDDERGVSRLEGYGVITWIEARNPTRVLLSRMTASGDIVVARVRGGGLVWGSTYTIVQGAVRAARLAIETTYQIDVGQVYALESGGIFRLTGRDGVTLRSFSYSYGSIARWSERDGYDLGDDDLGDDELGDDELGDDDLGDDDRFTAFIERQRREERRNLDNWMREYYASMRRDDAE